MSKKEKIFSAVKKMIRVEPIVIKNQINFIKDLIKDPKTPDSFHLIDLASLLDRYLLWKKSLPRVTPFYAIKANHDPVIVATLAELGCGFDCASDQEIKQVIDLGVSPQQIIFAHPRKSIASLNFAKKKGVMLVTFDSKEELEKLRKELPNGHYLLRIKTDDSHSTNPLSSKFGVSLNEAKEIIDFAFSESPSLPLIGLSFHVGSQCHDVASFSGAIQDAASLFHYAEERWKKRFSLLDIGGGWPGLDDQLFQEMANTVNINLERFFPSDVQIIAEPGRYFSTQALTVTMRIVGIKKDTINGTTSYSYYLTNGIYGFFLCSALYNYDPIKIEEQGWAFLPLIPHSKELYPSRLWGPTCDAYDRIHNQIFLPKMNEGDYIYTQNAGAYTSSLQTPFNQITPSKAYYVFKE